MASRKTVVNEIELGDAPLERFRRLVGEEVWSELQDVVGSLKDAMDGRVLWNVNSTARGGGVAEMLASLIPYDRDAGIDERWAVIQGSPDFFNTTKKLHTLLHGVEPDGGILDDSDRERYEEVSALNAGALAQVMHRGDVVILHDPQTAGLAPALASRGMHIVWRSHIGVDQPNEVVRKAWDFLRPYLRYVSAFVFSRSAYVFDGLDHSHVRIIAPCIDPFGSKNHDLAGDSMDAILQAGGIVQGGNGHAMFLRRDGSRARITHSADLGRMKLPHDARIVTQVSRWDRLKDPIGVMEAFAGHIAPRTDAFLVLAGPAATSVKDDPEQPEVLGELTARRQQMVRELRDRVVIAKLPMEDTDENASIVNALQRRSNVVVQKSLAEGFGLTVAEAMWKGRPVVASSVGGIVDQIEDGKNGLLVDDSRDLEGFGRAVVRLLEDERLARRLGAEARRTVISKFITPCHLIDQARMVTDVLRQG
jgi:trehalose synthase